MSDTISDLKRVQSASTQDSFEKASVSTGSESVPSTSGSAKLPYQATHQVELLHLQADIDALLYQLQSLKQQRASVSQDSISVQEHALPALALR